MNVSVVVFFLGYICNFAAVFLMLPCVVAAIYQEKTGYSFLIAAVFSLILGIILTRFKPKNRNIYAKEGFVIVALSWITLSIIGALPFTISGEIPNYIDALFETVSGFTTTGASILTNVEALSKSMLFWRSFTHWIGGMGVLVFIMSILPLAAKNGGNGGILYLMKAESPGPVVGKLVPHVKNTATILYGMYFVLSLVEFILLVCGGLPTFDSLTITFGTAGTGGFAILNSSIGEYSSYVQIIITIFMILFGVNFSVYYLIWTKRYKEALSSTELRVYLGIIIFAIVSISINISHLFPSLFDTIKHAAFQVASIITTTGFASCDFNKWPEYSRVLLVMLMFIGACAGSTGGGMKVSRFIILVKTVRKEIKTMLHPKSVKRIKLDGHVVEHETVRSVNIYFMSYILIFAFSILILSLENFDLVSTFTAVAATINNIGPGLEMVGPAANYSDFSCLSEIVMIFDMLLGRLEIFPLLILFAPQTWKR